MGAAARQADYQYGIPMIDAGGTARLVNTNENVLPARRKEIERAIQQQYDLIHDSLINLILKFPDVAIPKISEITGRFQDNPSAHWGEHLQQWITGTLPETLMKAFGDELSAGFQQLGMSPEKFKQFFDAWKNIDPKMALQGMNSLADVLNSIGPTSKIYQFFRSNNAPDIFGTAGSATFQTEMGMLGIRGRMTPGQLIGEQDAEIIKKTR
jgi:hypothetical protein